jgi:LCP family protein required for cell wall assembly
MSETPPRSTATQNTAAIARHGRLENGNPFLFVLKIVGIALAVVAVSVASIGSLTLLSLDNKITAVHLVGETDGPPPALGDYDGGFNVLVVGSDVCEDGSGCHGRGDAELNDVTILLHVSQDQTNAVAVSIPRDMVVPIPSCPDPKGGKNFHSMSAQPINVSLMYGGLPCTVLTVSTLTGLDIPFAVEVKFSGVVNISNAIGGVPVCIDGPIDDRYSGFSVPAAGEYTLAGHDALAFLRTRHGVGDGSDLGRISSQQQFLSSLVRTIKAPNGALTDPLKLFNIATVVSENTVVSASLKNPVTMVTMAQVLKKLPLEKIVFVQYPGVTGQPGIYEGKVAPTASVAAALFAKIKADQPFLPSKTGLGSKGDVTAPPSSDPAPSASGSASTAPDAPLEVIQGVQGQSAAASTCAKHN